MSRWDGGDPEGLEDWYEQARMDACAEDEALAWWADEIERNRERLGIVRIIAGIHDPEVDAHRESIGLEPLRGPFPHADSPAVVAVLAEVARLERLAQGYLEDPEAMYPAGDGALTGLEIAEHFTDAACRLLSAAVRRTHSLKALVGLRVASGRIAALRSHTTSPPRPTAVRPIEAYTPAGPEVMSLTHAAHAPPAGGVQTASVLIAGGGPL